MRILLLILYYFCVAVVVSTIVFFLNEGVFNRKFEYWLMLLVGTFLVGIIWIVIDELL